jgi:hypothetical protein
MILEINIACFCVNAQLLLLFRHPFEMLFVFNAGMLKCLKCSIDGRKLASNLRSEGGSSTDTVPLSLIDAGAPVASGVKSRWRTFCRWVGIAELEPQTGA